MTYLNSYMFWHCSLLMSMLHYLVSYTLHDISAQDLFRQCANMTDVCKRLSHYINTVKNWQLWCLMLHILIFNITRL